MPLERLKNSKDAAILRNKWLKAQSNIDPIIKEEIKNPVLDHDHLTGNCRQTLDSEVNAALGKIENCYKRFLKHKTKKPIIEILENIITYLKQDYSQNPLHYLHIKTELRHFKRLPSSAQINLIKKLKLEPKNNLKGRVRQIRKLILDDKLEPKVLEEMCKAFK